MVVSMIASSARGYWPARGIENHDQAGSSLVVVANQTFTRQVFPNKNPVGEWLRIDGKLRQIVGVAEDGPSNELQEDREPFLWLPYSQAPRGARSWLKQPQTRKHWPGRCAPS